MIKKLLTNPIVVLGAVFVAYRLMKQKPEGRFTRTVDELVEGGTQAASTVASTATSLIDTAVQTGQDVLGIYQDGGLGDMLMGDASTGDNLDIETGEAVTGEANPDVVNCADTPEAEGCVDPLSVD
tara:strand:- start:220 stop:597 length:378 start_codon:yes stop_codon:yes gene_type:complete